MADKIGVIMRIASFSVISFLVLGTAATDQSSTSNHREPLKSFLLPDFLSRPGGWYLDEGLISRGIDPARRLDISCELCTNLANNFIDLVKSGTPLNEIIEAAIEVCTLIGASSEFNCRWQIEAQAPAAAWVALNNPNLDIPRLCAESAGADDCGYSPNPDEWTVELPDVPKPPVDRPEIAGDIEALKILHISDPHVDPLYEEGSESVCERFICCQSVSGPAEVEAAGLFGSYRYCDTPWITMEESLKHISETHADIDLIFYTGDTPSHDAWFQTVEGNVGVLDQAQDLIKQYFGNTPVFNAMGNHDPYPPNTFSFKELDLPANISSAPFYEQAWNTWGPWLSEDQMENVLSGGMYSAIPRPGLRVIGLNNMIAHRSNWYLFSGVPDPNGQLAWLANELQAAEDSGEKVYLLGHVPPGFNGMDPTWGKNFAKIVNRYESTIRGQFYGHTHIDEFKLFINEDGEPSSAGFIGPSLTPFINMNPGYRVFHVDGRRGEESTWALLDHETWIFDLAEANGAGEPTWFKSYNMRDEYQLSDLTPTSIRGWIDALETDDEIFEKYYRHHFKEHLDGHGACDANCRAKLICEALTTDPTDLSNC